MKKSNLIIAILLVLSVSVIFLGCPPPPPDEEVTPFEEALGYAETMGIDSAKIKAPAGGTFDDYYVDSEANPSKLALAWTGCDAAKYTTYKQAYGINTNERFVFSNTNTKKIDNFAEGFNAYIDFFATAPANDQTADGNLNLPLQDGSIVFILLKVAQ